MTSTTTTTAPATVSLTYTEGGQTESLAFEEFIPEAEVLARLDEMAAYLVPLMAAAKRPEDNVLVPVQAGGSQVADALMTRICAVCLAVGPKIAPLKVSSYKGTRNGPLTVEQDVAPGTFKGKQVFIVDEVIDRGHTMNRLIHERIAPEGPAAIHIVTLVRKPDAHEVQLPPIIAGFDTPSDFLLGWGMDWHGMGRWLHTIYRLQGGEPAGYTKPPFPHGANA